MINNRGNLTTPPEARGLRRNFTESEVKRPMFKGTIIPSSTEALTLNLSLPSCPQECGGRTWLRLNLYATSVNFKERR